MQRQIDDGLAFCGSCDRFGYDTFCGQCGARFVGDERDWRECPGCHVTACTDYCPRCGKNIVDDVVRAFEDGTIDLEAENQMCDELLERWENHDAAKRGPVGIAEAALAEFGTRE